MNQIFRDNLPFMIVGIVVGTVLAFLPRQTKGAKRLSRTILSLAVLYPILIVLLYCRRERLGESYAYLVYGVLLGILLAIIAGIMTLSWFVVYIRGIVQGGEPEPPPLLKPWFLAGGAVTDVVPPAEEAGVSRRTCYHNAKKGTRRESPMPEISRFYGIVIAMFFNEHNPPQLHAQYGGEKVAIDIRTLQILEGRIAPRALGLVIEWASQHQDELLEDWQLARNDQPTKSIEPLR